MNQEEILNVQNPYLEKLPEKVKLELFTFLFDDVLYTFNYFFSKIEKSKYHLCLYLQPRIYSENAIIIESDKTVHELLFTTLGKFQIGAVLNSITYELYSIETSSIIGDFFVFNKVKSFLQYRALTAVQGFSLPDFVILKVVNNHKHEFQQYLDVVNMHFGSLKDRIDNKLLDTKVTEWNELKKYDSDESIDFEIESIKEEKEFISLLRTVKDLKTKKFELNRSLIDALTQLIYKKFLDHEKNIK